MCWLIDYLLTKSFVAKIPQKNKRFTIYIKNNCRSFTFITHDSFATGTLEQHYGGYLNWCFNTAIN